MNISSFLQALFIGFTVAATVGPIAILCIQRTLTRGWRVGFASGLGVAAADGLYGILGGLGLAAIAAFLSDAQSWLPTVGGAVLILLGIKIFFTKAELNLQAEGGDTDAKLKGLAAAFSSVFLLTMANPFTILFFAAIYSGIDLDLQAGVRTAGLFGISIFLGSAAWWLILTSGVNLVRGKLTNRILRTINYISGFVIGAFGFALLL
ncbi:MAG: LysE family translocator [Chloroflexi bacterium]|nr:LysE family translocator [Chloroflexota bacterium]